MNAVWHPSNNWEARQSLCLTYSNMPALMPLNLNGCLNFCQRSTFQKKKRCHQLSNHICSPDLFTWHRTCSFGYPPSLAPRAPWPCRCKETSQCTTNTQCPAQRSLPGQHWGGQQAGRGVNPRSSLGAMPRWVCIFVVREVPEQIVTGISIMFRNVRSEAFVFKQKRREEGAKSCRNFRLFLNFPQMVKGRWSNCWRSHYF